MALVLKTLTTNQAIFIVSSLTRLLIQVQVHALRKQFQKEAECRRLVVLGRRSERCVPEVVYQLRLAFPDLGDELADELQPAMRDGDVEGGVSGLVARADVGAMLD